MTIQISNWNEFIHYKDRSAPWIKLSKKMIDSRAFNMLSPLSAKGLFLLLMIASESNGNIESDIDSIAFRLRMSNSDTKKIIAELFNSGFLCDADDAPVGKKHIREFYGFGNRYITTQVKQAVMERDSGTCQSCGSVENIEFDHINPISNGGSSDQDNIQLLCRKCNRAKKDSVQIDTDNEETCSNVLALCTTKEKPLEKQKRFNPEAYLLSFGVNDEVSADWLQHRKAKKAPATKTSIDRINDEASKACMSLQEALETMCQRGWTGFKSDWVQSNNYTTQRQERDSATIRALGLSQARTFNMGDL